MTQDLLDIIILCLFGFGALRANSGGIFLLLMSLAAVVWTTALTLLAWDPFSDFLARNMPFVAEHWLSFASYWMLTAVIGLILGSTCRDINTRYHIAYPHAVNMIGGTLIAFVTLLALLAHMLLGLSYSPLHAAKPGPTTILRGIGGQPTNILHRVEIEWLYRPVNGLTRIPVYTELSREAQAKAAEDAQKEAPAEDEDYGTVLPLGPRLPGALY